MATKAAAGDDSARRAFVWRGHRYALYRRRDDRFGRWHLRVQNKKFRIARGLGTSHWAAAVDRAKAFLEDLSAGRVEVRGRQSLPSTLGSVISLYRELANIAPRSIRNNILAMEQVLRETGSGPAEPFPLTSFSATLARQFQDAFVRRYTAGLPEQAAREARERALRSSRSLLQQARSLFGRAMVERYTDRGLVMPPGVHEFVRYRLAGRIAKREYLPPPDSVIDRTFQAVESLRDKDRDLYIAFWLAVGAGLRLSEIRRARWEDFVERSGRLWISGGVGKDGERIEVPLQARAVCALAPFRKTAGPVVRGEWFRRLNRWMAGLGWQTTKKLHELRAYVGSLLYVQNPHAAMRFLRHKSIRMTEQFYVRYRTQVVPLDVLPDGPVGQEPRQALRVHHDPPAEPVAGQ